MRRAGGVLVLAVVSLLMSPACTSSQISAGIDTPPTVSNLNILAGSVVCYGDSNVVGGFGIPPWPTVLPCNAAGGERGAGYAVHGVEGHTIPSKVYSDVIQCWCLSSTVILSGGENDAMVAGGNLDLVWLNMQLLDGWLRQQGVKVIWTTPPNFNPANLGTAGDYANTNLAAIDDLMDSFPGTLHTGAALGLPLNPAYDIGDGIHLNGPGSAAYGLELRRLLALQGP